MIYVDASVLLAQLLAEDRRPPRAFWDQPLIASRLAEYEVWNRIHARGLAGSHGEAARQLLARVSMVELSPLALRRALEPFPGPVRTLDALHLASVYYLRGQRLRISLATFDERMAASATAMSIPLESLAAEPSGRVTPGAGSDPRDPAASPSDQEADEEE
jgi:predicted nucleic acid-binding protein